MKRRAWIIPIVLVIVILFVSTYKEKGTFQELIINNYSDKSIKEIYNIDTDFEVNNIAIFETTYEELIEIMGKPISITNIDDDIVITNYGYFSVLSYEGVEFTINLNNRFDDLTNSKVIEIDILSPSISTKRGSSINDTKEQVMKSYSIEKSYPLEKNPEYPFDSIIIKGLRRGKQEIDINEYDEFCYIESKEKPIALIFLFKENIVKRIVIRHLTAG